MRKRVIQRRLYPLAAVVGLFVACQGSPDDQAGSLQMLVSEPVGIMGTQTRLAVVLPTAEVDRGKEILGAAEAELRRIEALMSTWIDETEISRFNAAVAEEAVPLSADSLEVLNAARQLFDLTEGAFDVTCRPLIERWRLAGEEDHVPTEEELAQARQESEWPQIELSEQGARKTFDTTCVDLSGIAKGFAIDRALSILRRSEAAGGLVEVGGDLRVFGTGPKGNDWSVGIRSPVENRAWGEMRLSDGAVCTSGDYARFIEIDGQRYSEIIDPRTGHPAERASSVTVVAEDAMTADAWATALSVLGPEGLSLLPADEGIEALVVTGDGKGGYRVEASEGFSTYLVSSEFEPGLERQAPQP